MPTKATTSTKGTAKPKPTVRTVSAKTKAKEDDRFLDDAQLTIAVREGLAAGKKLHELSAELGRPAGKLAMLRMIDEVKPAEQIKGTEAQVKAGIVKAREAGFSWGAITARTRPLLAEQRVKALYTEATGIPTLGLRNGRGGRPPGTGKTTTATATKPAATKRPAAVKGTKAPAKAKAPAMTARGVKGQIAAAAKAAPAPKAPAKSGRFSASARSAAAKAGKTTPASA